MENWSPQLNLSIVAPSVSKVCQTNVNNMCGDERNVESKALQWVELRRRQPCQSEWRCCQIDEQFKGDDTTLR